MLDAKQLVRDSISPALQKRREKVRGPETKARSSGRMPRAKALRPRRWAGCSAAPSSWCPFSQRALEDGLQCGGEFRGGRFVGERGEFLRELVRDLAPVVAH